MQEENALLVLQAKKGNADAMDALLAQYEKRIYNISLRVTGNEHDAFDAAQESLIKIYKSIASFRGEASFSSFVYRLTVNTCIDFLRKRKNDISIEASIEDGMSFEDKSNADDPVKAYINSDLNENIQNALQKLDEEQRILIVLKDIQGFSYEDISQILKISMGTVKSRLFRGREKLKKMLAHYLDD
jgi:RNA polymerase sigma-70 factor (ECF subfamily)